MRSARENIAPNPLVQGLKHLASLDGASAWRFAKVNWTTNPQIPFLHISTSGVDWEFHWWKWYGMHWGRHHGRLCPLCDHAGYQVPYVIHLPFIYPDHICNQAPHISSLWSIWYLWDPYSYDDNPIKFVLKIFVVPISIAIRVFYGLVLLGMVFYCCFKKSWKQFNSHICTFFWKQESFDKYFPYISTLTPWHQLHVVQSSFWHITDMTVHWAEWADWVYTNIVTCLIVIVMKVCRLCKYTEYSPLIGFCALFFEKKSSKDAIRFLTPHSA